MNAQPAVSVLMPSFNAGAFLKIAVESILNQTFTDFELIIIDDGSTDDSFDPIRRIEDDRIKLVRNEHNMGLIATRNMAVSYARAPLLACLDADDLAMPSRLERQVETFRVTPGLAVLGSSAYLIDSKGREFDAIDVPTSSEEIRREILRGNKIIHSSVMMRTSVVKEFDGYPKEFSLAEDYALWVRIIESHKVMNLPERLIKYRVHKGQVSYEKLQTMWQMTTQIRTQAWVAFKKSGKSEGVFPPAIPTQWSRLRGDIGSLGRDCLYWARLYRRMGNWPDALKLIANGLVSAPFCIALYSVLLPHQLLVKYWRRPEQINESDQIE